MRGRKGNGIVIRLLVALTGLLSAVLLAAVFYGTMVYQLGEETDETAAAAQPLPGGVLALGEGELTGEETKELAVGGESCRATVRTYRLAGEESALAITASPAAYLERLALEDWQPQLITGFVLAGLDAVYEKSGERSMLVARAGETVYVLEAEIEEQALYALGAGAWLESQSA